MIHPVSDSFIASLVANFGREAMRPSRIIAEIETKHGVSIHDLRSHRRFPELVMARQELYFRLRTETTLSYAGIGRMLDRDHTTVLHGVKAFAQGVPEQGRAA